MRDVAGSGKYTRRLRLEESRAEYTQVGRNPSHAVVSTTQRDSGPVLTLWAWGSACGVWWSGRSLVVPRRTPQVTWQTRETFYQLTIPKSRDGCRSAEPEVGEAEHEVSSERRCLYFIRISALRLFVLFVRLFVILALLRLGSLYPRPLSLGLGGLGGLR